ncbi:hypothetical protein RCCS2_10940 [Roseobacter sp. CCS2]|nr:hypothetical protein RCCS2_10940 [Roseobacter sp. CCS2]
MIWAALQLSTYLNKQALLPVSFAV